MAEPVVLINAAEDFTTALSSPGFRQAASGFPTHQAHPALYRPIRT